MRRAIPMLLMLLIAGADLAAQRPPAAEPARPPGKGDEVVVRGCVAGTRLQALSTRRAEADEGLQDAITYRLTGSKNLLRTLRTDHDGEIVEIRGVLKSKLPETRGKEIGGKAIGNTRIVVGAPPRGNSPGDMVPYMPVLEAASFNPIGSRCLR